MAKELSEDELAGVLVDEHGLTPDEANETLAYLQTPVPEWVTGIMVRIRDTLMSGKEPDPEDLEKLNAHLEGGWNAKQ